MDCRTHDPELVRCTADGVRAADSRALIVVWDWSWHSAGMPDPQDEIVRSLKPSCALMADFERGTAIRRGGVPMTVDEYAISVVGPSPRALSRAIFGMYIERLRRFGSRGHAGQLLAQEGHATRDLCLAQRVQ